MISWDFLKSYDVGKLVSQLVFTIFISSNHFPFHLLWKKLFVKYLQIPKFQFQAWVWQNVSNDFLLAWLKFQTKIASLLFSIHYDSLLQNARDIVLKYNAILLQNASEVYNRMRQVFYCKMRQLLQNVPFITNRDSTLIYLFI